MNSSKAGRSASSGEGQATAPNTLRRFVPPRHLEMPPPFPAATPPRDGLKATGVAIPRRYKRLIDWPCLVEHHEKPKNAPSFVSILGSASPDLLRQTSESLAGRMETIELTGFKLSEVGAENTAQHWLRGGFPLSFLAENEKDCLAWRKNFIASFLERDLPSFGVGVSSITMNRFWMMLAHYHGQVWNASEIAGSMNVAAVTAKRYLDILTSTFMICQLQPWHENLGKRQVKAPKIYFRDSGLFHSMLGIRSESDLFTHPKLGASWEGYALEESIRHIQPDQAYFWATHGGADLDLLLLKDGKRIGIECKRKDAPKMTPSMKIAFEDLKLDELKIIYPGSKRYTLAEGITAQPLASLA